MRIGALLLVGIGFLCAAACTANTSSAEVCVSGGGACVATGGVNPVACKDELPLPCDTGFVCCELADGAPGTTATTPTHAADAH